jgi:hypothetical protein
MALVLVLVLVMGGRGIRLSKPFSLLFLSFLFFFTEAGGRSFRLCLRGLLALCFPLFFNTFRFVLREDAE